MSVSNVGRRIHPLVAHSSASVPNAADSGQLCARCEEDGIERQATGERSGEPLCAEHAQSYDDREPPDPDLSGPTLREQYAHFAETYRRDRWT